MPRASVSEQVQQVAALLQGEQLDQEQGDQNTAGEGSNANPAAPPQNLPSSKDAERPAGGSDSGDDDQGGDPDFDGIDLGITAGDEAGEGDDQAEAPGSLAALAKAAGVDPAKLYELQVPLRDGETLTLGQLKDIANDAGELESRAADFETRQVDFENEMIRARAELQSIVSLLPHVPPQLIEQARQQYQTTLDRERHALLTVKPEWRDDAVFQRAQDDILEAVSDYGFTRADLDAVIDHRLTKLVHDFAMLRKRVDAAKAKGKEVRRGAPRGGRRVNRQQQRNMNANAAIQKAKGSKRIGDQVNAVAALLQSSQGE